MQMITGMVRRLAADRRRLMGIVAAVVVSASAWAAFSIAGAATYAVPVEAEAGQVAGKAGVVDLNGASGGKHVKFGESAVAQGRTYGVLQATVQRAEQDYTAGIRVVTLELHWENYQPAQGTFNTDYINATKAALSAYRSKGLQVILSFGVHHPPAWVLAMPNARYVNQYGAKYESADSGKRIANLVFNQAIRDRYETYMQRVFQDLGTDFYAVRLGGGWYDELNYPETNYGGRTNSYWAFDPIANGQASGLPSGMATNPVPGWLPGTRGADHTQASRFANWYMDSLKHYHDWQIRTARKYYSGQFNMMYPSWGVRPGQLQTAINADLDGSTSPEVNGEVQRGFDFARYVAGITDPKVMVYTTWIDAPFGNDDSANESDWRPVHWLSALAARNPQRLAVGGENTGGADHAAMQFSFAQADKYDLSLMMWAFEPELYDGQHATAEQFRQLVAQYR